MTRPAATGRRVAVIGGGLAGIAAALDCAAGGARVTLLEVRPRLGGAVYSFERDGLRIDNGQHVFLRCFTAYRALLARLGSDSKVWLQPRLEIPLARPGGELTALRRSGLPAPLHLAGTLLRYRVLTVRQRLAAARVALALGRLDPRDPALDRQTLGSWLAAHGQSPHVISALWDLIALPSLNLPADQASLALAAFVFKRGLLERADAGDIGFHRCPQSEIVGEPALRALRDAGVEVRLGWGVELVAAGEGGFGVWRRGGEGEEEGGCAAHPHAADRRAGARRGGGERVDADAVIVALPRARAADLIEPLDPDTAARAKSLRDTPIVNIHVVYDRKVCEQRFVGGLESPVQYVFDRSDSAGVGEGRQYLALSQSGADEEMGMNVDALRERYLPALANLFPRTREARVERFFATREHAATLRAEPGVGALRPGPRTAIPGLLLAGAWTDTGWPATLESAVLSGHAAAREALGRCGEWLADGRRTA
ncbi:MAG TPA: hydroxysqualene dehydroxylase HpnE [Solirubrobacteraceae bacterium]|jgi:squalene-associated FAD-dependent desaturase|nr:hydroxysqualene dehydroxylase HpnE [Solirubrobacteraceae bacterium]